MHQTMTMTAAELQARGQAASKIPADERTAAHARDTIAAAAARGVPTTSAVTIDQQLDLALLREAEGAAAVQRAAAQVAEAERVLSQCKQIHARAQVLARSDRETVTALRQRVQRRDEGLAALGF